jgi:hypothetical protein
MLKSGKTNDEMVSSLEQLRKIKNPNERMTKGVEIFGVEGYKAVAPIVDTNLELGKLSGYSTIRFSIIFLNRPTSL